MSTVLDKSALFEAMNAFWEAKPGCDNGVEAAIAAYLTRMRLTGLHETVLAENERMKARVFAVAAE